MQIYKKKMTMNQTIIKKKLLKIYFCVLDVLFIYICERDRERESTLNRK